MHDSVMRFVEAAVKRYDLADKQVLEVGSRNINGTPRGLFTGIYWGVDMLDGPDVDQVCDAHELCAGHNRLDFFPAEVVLCLEMLEHDSAPWVTVEQMRQCVKVGAMLLLTARGYDERGCFPVHGFPADYWRYSTDGMTELLRFGGWEVLSCEPDPSEPGVFAIAKAC